ncbi:polysaccharide deacetylase family protein [Streptomyces kanamyceticus]|uniref:Polysaccharide deacetylase family protein n=1 Tax=Streptomyces kanamyceticus TaxID=1967 RepID=A0A5J6GAM2_STRKN|nr:polysaccharide deacetylase family protein [Streptomyces kanamyceticus]QEU91005.1 polysaccharide deacetylase family protein [Streptomyces kanamyceticus]
MPAVNMTSPHKTTRSTKRVRRTASALAAGAALALAMTGCTKLDTTSPATVRTDAADAKAADQGKFGTVDCRKAKCVALTFDAGPSENTPRLLKILKEKKVPATFFTLGKNHIEKYPELVKQMDAEGHEVASHTWSHKILTKIDAKEARKELERPNEAIEKLISKKPTLMRPPQGRTNDDINKLSKELGLSEILWSVTAKDYTTNDSKLIEKRVLDQTKRDGIILLHDIYKGTVPAVPGVIDGLKKRGFVFVTVPQLLAPGKAEPGKIYR